MPRYLIKCRLDKDIGHTVNDLGEGMNIVQTETNINAFRFRHRIKLIFNLLFTIELNRIIMT